MIPQNFKTERTSHAYLLKIWCEEDQQISPGNSWRFSLEEVQTGTRRGFRDLETLLVYLSDLTTPLPGSVD
jgi:hypothetical protein